MAAHTPVSKKTPNFARQVVTQYCMSNRLETESRADGQGWIYLQWSDGIHKEIKCER